MFPEERTDDQSNLASEASDAQETKYARTNQMAPRSSKELRLQADSSKRNPSNWKEGEALMVSSEVKVTRSHYTRGETLHTK